MEKVEVSKEFILDLHNEIIWSSVKAKIEKEFPQLFETKLEFGKWYKRKANPKCIIFKSENEDNCYGFGLAGNWSDGWLLNNSNSTAFTLATPEEVETALVNEAKKRGFKYNNFKCLALPNLTHENCKKLKYSKKDNTLAFTKGSNRNIVFKDGKWAEILPQPIKMTVAEVEAKLGHAVEIVK